MKQLQKSDLKEGEIYKQLDYNYIFLYNKNETSDNFNDGTAISSTIPRYFKRWTANGFEKNMIEATLEEKHWLKTCIKDDQFVSYEEAMKSFSPEYVEYINTYDTSWKFGKIYKVDEDGKVNFESGAKSFNSSHSRNPTLFKTSTKEAYDAQFVVKEPEFVLEEPKDKVLAHLIQSDITLIHSVECSEGGVYRIGDKITVFDKYSPNKGKPFIIKRFRWSKDKSKICAVTELHTPNGIGLDKIELHIEPKVKVKDDFVLPEKWRLKVSEDYLDILVEWRRTLNLKHIINVSDIKSYCYIAEDGYGAKFDDGCKIITFEQFKKHVLKDE